jgi:4-amino-4-deoxy-L-arabinose transferase-like glycosyltransferase
MAVPSGPTLRKVGLILLALYVAAGVIYSCMLPAVGRFPDEYEYLALTNNLLHGPGFSMDGVHLTAFRPPGYPFFLAAIGSSVIAARVLQFLMLGGIVLLLVRLFPEKDRDAAVLITTIVVAIYPLFFYTSTTLYPQTLGAFLFVLVLVLVLTGRRPWAMWLLIGAIYGYLILVIPTFLLTLFVLLAVAWWLKIIRWHEGALLTAAAAVIVLAWTARNYAEFREFVPVASYSGAQLLIGNCENTNPVGGSGNIDTQRYGQEARALGLNEFQADRYYRDAAIAWIKAHPGRAIVLYFEKAANFFNVYNEYAPESKGEVTPWRQALLGVCYGLLLALLVWRLVEMKRFPLTSTEKLFLAVFVLTAFTQAIFFTRIRLRLPYDYLIVAIIAMHLARRFDLWRNSARGAAS